MSRLNLLVASMTFSLLLNSIECVPIDGFIRLPTKHLNNLEIEGYFYTSTGEGSCTISLQPNGPNLTPLDDIGVLKSVEPGESFDFGFVREDLSANPPDMNVKVICTCTSDGGETSTFERDIIIYGSPTTKPHFEHRIKYPRIVSKKQDLVGPTIKQYRGSAICTVSEAVTGYSETRNINGNLDYWHFQVGVESFEEDTDLEFLISCEDQNFPDLTYEYCLPMTVLCKNKNKIPEFDIKFYNFYNYDTKFPFYIDGDANGFTCQYYVSGRPDVTYFGPTTYNHDKNLNGYFTMSSPITFDVILHGDCTKEGNTLNYEYRFAGRDDKGANGDPHFTQKVLDTESKQLKRICYDVTGKAGQNINIVTLHNDNVRVLGELLDDYYMHKVRIFIGKDLYLFTTKKITRNNKYLFNWNKITHKNIGGIIIRSKKGKISIKSIQKKIDIEVTREKGLTNHLNVNVKTENSKTDGGLIGFIGRRNYKLFESVQEKMDTVTMFIDNFVKFGSKISRDKNECILMNVEDLIYPKLIKEFVNDEL